jgi:RNA polymerase sigma-70 factor (ECF subfamily)
VTGTSSQRFLSPTGTEVRKPEGCGQEQPLNIEAVYCKYHRRVFAWCFRMVRNTEDAEDLTQDAFIHVMHKLHTFRGEASLSTWLYRVVTNTVLMRMRRKRLPQTSLEEIPEGSEGAGKPHYELKSNDRTMGAIIARVDLERVFDQLPSGFRAAFFLHDSEDYSHREIGELMGWSTGTSKSQLHKARQRLRQLLEDVPGEEGLASSRCHGPRQQTPGMATTSQPKDVAGGGRGRGRARNRVGPAGLKPHDPVIRGNAGLAEHTTGDASAHTKSVGLGRYEPGREGNYA